MYGLYLPNPIRPQCFWCWSHTVGRTSLHHLQWHDYWNICLYPVWNLCRKQQHKYHSYIHCQCRRNHHPRMGWTHCNSSRLGSKQLSSCHLRFPISHASGRFHLLERLELRCWKSRSLTLGRSSGLPCLDYDHQGCHAERFYIVPIHCLTLTSD